MTIRAGQTGDKVYATGPYYPICSDLLCKSFDKIVANFKTGDKFPSCKCGKVAFFQPLQDATYTDLEDPFKDLFYGENGLVAH